MRLHIPLQVVKTAGSTTRCGTTGKSRNKPLRKDGPVNKGNLTRLLLNRVLRHITNTIHTRKRHAAESHHA